MLYVYLSVCLSACLSIYMSVYIYPHVFVCAPKYSPVSLTYSYSDVKFSHGEEPFCVVARFVLDPTLTPWPQRSVLLRVGDWRFCIVEPPKFNGFALVDMELLFSRMLSTENEQREETDLEEEVRDALAKSGTVEPHVVEELCGITVELQVVENAVGPPAENEELQAVKDVMGTGVLKGL